MSKDIEELVISTYKNNLLYFQNEQPELFSKLASFDSAVEQNLYKERYELLFQDGYFDVLERSSGSCLYSKDSNIYADNASKSIDHKKNTYLFESFKKIDIKEDDLKPDGLLDNGIKGFAPIIDYINQNRAADDEMEYIKKFIFFGVGLGTHITKIDEKIGAETYLIIEDDLELFRLSLFTCPYNELAQKSRLVFSVFDSKEEFKKPAQNFLHTKFYHNHYLKYFQMLNHSTDKLEELHIQIASQSHNLFFYNNILKQYIQPLEYLKEEYNFLDISTLKNSPLLSRPVLFLAAGPSLGRNIPWLKKNRYKFIIAALSATLSILEKEGIVPDIVTHIDGFETSAVHFNKLNSLDFLKDTIFLFSARTPKSIVDILDKDHIFFFENGSSYKAAFNGLGDAPCVGSATYLALLRFGVKELYLLGLDMSVDSQSGSTHSDGHEYAQILKPDSSSNGDSITFKESLIKTGGNFKKEVYTTPNFMISIDSINNSSNLVKMDRQSVYNLNDGVLFKNTIPTRTDTLDTDNLKNIDKKELASKLKSVFLSNSSNRLANVELRHIKERYDYALKIQTIIFKQQNRTFRSHEEFLNTLVTLYNDLATESSTAGHDLSLVYQEYFRFIYTFIFDFFNTKGVYGKEIHADMINSLLCSALLEIQKSYEKPFF